MNRSLLLVSFVLLTGLLALLVLRQQKTLETQTLMEQKPIPVPRHAIGSPILYPMPAADAESEVLPALGESDGTIRDRLTELFDPWEFGDLFLPEQLIRRIVVTVDNLPRKEVSQKYLPLRRPEGALVPAGSEKRLVIGPENHKRYLPYVRLAEKADTGKLVAAYSRLYPLFQDAYEELGYPNGYFNDRLVAVIDHLLASPEIEEPVRIVQPVTVYKFADPKLENLSAGQKLMIRVGPENATRVKARLREFRQELAALPKDRPAD